MYCWFITWKLLKRRPWSHCMRGSKNIFSGEVGWGPGQTARKQSGRCCCFFFSPQLILQFTEGVQWFYYRENYTFPRIQRGPTFFRGDPTFSRGVGGVQMLFSIEIHITCDFPGGSRPPIPLWIHTCPVSEEAVWSGSALFVFASSVSKWEIQWALIFLTLRIFLWMKWTAAYWIWSGYTTITHCRPTYRQHRDEELHSNHKTQGRQTKQSNQLSFPHQHDQPDCAPKHRTNTEPQNGSNNQQGTNRTTILEQTAA